MPFDCGLESTTQRPGSTHGSYLATFLDMPKWISKGDHGYLGPCLHTILAFQNYLCGIRVPHLQFWFCSCGFSVSMFCLTVLRFWLFWFHSFDFMIKMIRNSWFRFWSCTTPILNFHGFVIQSFEFTVTVWPFNHFNFIIWIFTVLRFRFQDFTIPILEFWFFRSHDSI